MQGKDKACPFPFLKGICNFCLYFITHNLLNHMAILAAREAGKCLLVGEGDGGSVTFGRFGEAHTHKT